VLKDVPGGKVYSILEGAGIVPFDKIRPAKEKK
jgi:hypothetical protein